MQPIRIIISEKYDGNMRFFEQGRETEAEIIENQSKLSASIGLDAGHTARIRTIYGNRKNFTEYQEITSENIKEYSIDNPESEIPVSDGLVTRDNNIGILLPLADCLGTVVYDDGQEIVGLLHSGRHNVEQDGPRKFIEFFTEKFGCDPANLRVHFSPCARNYRIEKLGGKKLPDAAREQFIAAGILPQNITEDQNDTATCDRFPSHSSGDVYDRFAILVR